MPRHTSRFSAASVIDAPAGELYRVIADYRHRHPGILPRPPFVSLHVEEGGTGAGTVFVARIRVLGRLQTFRGVVTEPEPGRVLVETTDTGYVTTFTVEPDGDGGRSRVTIATEAALREGLAGTIEGWFIARLLRPVYVRELEMLASAVGERSG